MADTPIPVVRLVPGTVVTLPDGVTLAVNIAGTNPPVWWPAGYIPTAGDAVKVLMVDGIAVVHSPVIAGQRPLTGTVAGVPVDGLLPVTTTSGTIQARYVGSAPANGTLVRLDWQSTSPWVWPSAAASTTPPVDPGGGGGPVAPPATQSGIHWVAAGDSGTWSAQGWSSYYGNNLTQGSYGGASYTGAWFYGSAPQQIAGRVVTGARVHIGSRRRMGNYNADLVLNIYVHTNPTRPAGDTTRVMGPVSVTLPPNAPPQWVELPASYGQQIVDAGGGLGIASGTYGGVTGVGEDASSGQLQLDWKI